MHDRSDLIAAARTILRENDRGSYTVPTKGLYPFQWNWDSCLTALGQRHFDEARALTEIETLFAHQWPDGMVPHIVFHVEDDGYFPGPDVWATGRPVPTSGITQPPVAGFALRRLVDRAPEPRRGRAPGAGRCCRRSPPGTAGSSRCATRMARGWSRSCTPGNPAATTPSTGTRPSSGCRPRASRPTPAATLSTRTPRCGRRRSSTTATSGWSSISAASAGTTAKLHDASPFQVVDPGFNAILIRSCSDLADLAEALGEPGIAEREPRLGPRAAWRRWKGCGATPQGSTCAATGSTGTLIESRLVGGLLPAFAPLPAERLAALAKRIETLAAAVPLHRAQPRPH